MKLEQLVLKLDNFLKTDEIEDKSQNGLQVEGKPEVKKISFAVDACMQSFQKAVESGSDMLIVHHGLFWSKPLMITGNSYKRIKLLIDNGLSLYASHLTLDLHPEIGNNIQIVKALELTPVKTFGNYHGIEIGFIGAYDETISFEEFVNKAKNVFGVNSSLYRFGSDSVKKVAVISGGGVQLISQTENTDIDTFLTGEPQHEIFHYTREIGKNLICAGHYATETFGIKALEQYVNTNYNIHTHFINLPTGL